jgi:hypothetical protein
LLLLLASVCGVIAFLGLIGTGPLARFLTTSTLYSRLDYWRAALAMFWDSPLTGKGIDSYGDHYREFRDDSAFRRFGEGQVADSSHNVFLDLLSGGGLFIALVFFLINLVPISMLVRKILRTEPFDWTAVCLLSLWFGYLVQASVSINQIGVGIWGWLLTAIIYGHAKLSVRDTQFYKNLPSWRNKLLTTVVSLVFITLSVLPLKSDSTFYAASSEADGLKMKRIAESWPKDSRRIYLTSAAFLNAGYNQISLNLSILGTQHNPRAYFLWKQIYDNKTTSSNLRSIAEEKLFVIEPRFKNNG